MKKINTRLAVETNKLITQTLSKEGGVYLPSIGSLSFATITEDGETINTIILNKEARHQSLIKIIEVRGNCSNEQAAMLYEKWIEEIREEDGSYNLTSLGVIANGRFRVEESLFNRLNVNSKRRIEEREREREMQSKIAEPQVAKPKVIKPQPTPTKVKVIKPAQMSKDNKEGDRVVVEPKRSSGVIGWIVAAILIVCAIPAIFIFGGDVLNMNEPTTNSQIVKAEPTTKKEVVAKVEVEVEEVEELKPATPQTMPESGGRPIPAIKPNDPVERLKATLTESTNPKKYRVVCGIFRSQRNAGAMLLDIDRKLGDKAQARVYLRDNTYMVTIHEADNFRDCSDYIRNIAVDHYESSWVYNSETMN